MTPGRPAPVNARVQPRARRNGSGAGRRSAGMTLLELLVAVTIAGLACTAVLLTLPDDGATLNRQADGFARQLRHARDEAVLGGHAVRVQADAVGYRFSRSDFGTWMPLHDGPFRARPWSDGVIAILPGRQEQLGFRFDPTGMAEPQAVLLAHGQARLEVSVDAAGQVDVHGAGR